MAIGGCEWTTHISASKYDFNDKNLHKSDQALHEYLNFYSFNLKNIDEYRCGTVSTGSRKLFIQAFIKRKSKGMVYVVHGYLDHSGGMSKTVNDLLADGYNVVTLDLPGHGFSQGEAGTVASFNEYIDAVESGYDRIRNSFKTKHIYGLGHSTGGAVLFHAVSENKIRLERLILVAPLYFPYRWRQVKGLLKTIGKLIPRSRRRFTKNSEDDLYRQFVKQDPLQVRSIKSEWMTAMDEWHNIIIDCPVVDIPVYLLQGKKDTTVDWKQSVAFYKQKCHNIQTVLFPDGRHQLLNEKEQVRRMIHWRIKFFLNGR